MKNYNVGAAYRRDKTSFFVEIWTQPLFWWSVAHLYHKYDKATEPFWKKLSSWHQRHFGKGLDYIPLVNRRDIRCANLMHKNKVCLAVVYITQEQYKTIRNGKPPTTPPRHEIKNPITPEE